MLQTSSVLLLVDVKLNGLAASLDNIQPLLYWCNGSSADKFAACAIHLNVLSVLHYNLAVIGKDVNALGFWTANTCRIGLEGNNTLKNIKAN